MIRCKTTDPGNSRENPASSCADVANQTGNYWILNSTGSAVQVFCVVNETLGATTGDWVRVAHFNMTNPDQQCPQAFKLYTNPKRLCGTQTHGCTSSFINTFGLEYHQVCGRVVGYQYRSPDAFGYRVGCSAYSCTIDEPYVDGLSITYGAPRKHIWTYAAALVETEAHSNPLHVYNQGRCPCSDPSGQQPPFFVGTDYYCESGLFVYPWSTVVYSGDPL